MANRNLGKLKPLRQYSELDVLPWFSLDNETGSKGSLVSMKASGLHPDQMTYVPFANLASTFTSSVNNAYSPQYVVRNKVKLATSGEFPVGMMLYDVLSTNLFGTNYRYDKERAKEREAVSSGDPVPIVQRGYFLINVGTGASVSGNGGSFLAVSDTVAGGYKVQASATNAVGEFLGPQDADGYAFVYLNTHKI